MPVTLRSSNQEVPMVLRRTVVHASAVLLVEAGWAALAMQGSHNARWKDIRTKKGNDRCADCSSRDTTWVVLDYGTLARIPSSLYLCYERARLATLSFGSRDCSSWCITCLAQVSWYASIVPHRTEL
eukprot:6188135-Pleurochrysis_carterae.AAC.5